MLSFGRDCIKSIATFFAASSLLGRRSSACMVPDISSAIMMSIPSLFSVRQLLDDCGRAMATISKPIASVLRMNGKCLNFIRNVLGYPFSLLIAETCMLASDFRSSQIYQNTIGSKSRSKNRYSGFLNDIFLLKYFVQQLFVSYGCTVSFQSAALVFLYSLYSIVRKFIYSLFNFISSVIFSDGLNSSTLV